MKVLPAAALASGAMICAAMAAEQVKLTDTQMDNISAGALVNAVVPIGDLASGKGVQIQNPVSIKICGPMASCVQAVNTANVVPTLRLAFIPADPGSSRMVLGGALSE